MVKKITKTQRNKIVRMMTHYHGKYWDKLAYLIYIGELNYGDTFEDSPNQYDDEHVDFMICSSEGCLQDAGLSEKERKIFDLLSLAR